MRFRHLPLVITTAFGLAVAACDSNPLYGNAVFETELDTITVYALNGTNVALPSAVDVYSRTALRAAASANGLVSFDFALDIDAAGKIILLPSKLIATDARGANVRALGVQTTTNAFDAVREAPGDGYKYDSAAVINVGQTVLLDSRHENCQSAFLPNIYAKLIIDSIGPGRRMHARIVSDPNCGFRGLVPNVVPEK